ncbi:MAG: NAD(P)/FAD-dependent oxidoreductase [Candidatus Nanopelagicales bacterium]
MTATEAAEARAIAPSADRAVVIVGAGFAGIGAAAELQRRGVTNFTIVERADAVGGVWRDNTYPGCQCDVPSSLYSFSFLPKTDWSDRFATQPEIQEYLQSAVGHLGLESKIEFGREVAQLTWSVTEQLWTVAFTSGEPISARMVIVGSGTLNEPNIPRIDGLADFEGELFHSANWPADFDPAGKRIAVIGTGASAVQFVPKIAAVAESVTVFQRTAPWVLPRGDRTVPRWQQQLNDRVPAAMSLTRGVDFLRRELMTNSFVRSGRMLDLIERTGRRHIAKHVADPDLRARVTPTYRPGCKRLLMSDTWYPTLSRPNVTLTSASISRLTRSGVIPSPDGAAGQQAESTSEVQVDVVVLATGFRVQKRSILSVIVGANGESMALAMFKTAPAAYLGSTLPGFPNLVLMTGPNTGLANNSMLLMIEAQARYAADMATYLARNRGVALDVRPAVMESFTSELEDRLGQSVWVDGGCASWYQDTSGRVTALWPGTTTEFRRRTRHISLADYRVVSPVP